MNAYISSVIAFKTSASIGRGWREVHVSWLFIVNLYIRRIMYKVDRNK